MTNKPESAAVEAVARYGLDVLRDRGAVIPFATPDADGCFVMYEDHQSALNALRGEVDRKSIEIDRFMDKWAAEIRRADAAERRVAELLAAIKEYRIFASCGNREAIARLDALTKVTP